MSSVKTKKNRAKIALIGPVYPYRGGIAQYTTQLHKSLPSNTHKTFSFKRMYPMFLYPGSHVYEQGHKNKKENGVLYTINVYWPFSWRKMTNQVLDNKCNVAVFTWWTLFWQPGFVYMARRLKKRGVKVVFLCHNVSDHDYGYILKKFSHKLLRQADAYIVQTNDEAKLLKSIIKHQAPIQQIAHPIYSHFPAPNKTLKKRGKLELLFFGFIRPYKGVDLLVKAVNQLEDKDIYLTIVGEVWGDKSRLVSQIKSLKIECHFEYVTPIEAANYFNRADVVVLPYTSATGSGVATLAYNYNKPILATNVSGLSDVVEEGKTGWLVKTNSAIALKNAILKIDRDSATKMKSNIKNYCRKNSWDAMAKRVIEFCGNLSD